MLFRRPQHLLITLVMLLLTLQTTSLPIHSMKEYSNKCKSVCEGIEPKLEPLKPCSQFRRNREDNYGHFSQICERSFFDSYRATCHQLCEEEHEKFVKPGVARCTGMGSEMKLKACEEGFFAGIDQTIEIMGRNKEVNVEEVISEDEWAKEKEKEKEEETAEKLDENKGRNIGSKDDAAQAGNDAPKVTIFFHNEAHERSEELKTQLLHQVKESSTRRVKNFIHVTLDQVEHTLELFYEEEPADSINHFCVESSNDPQTCVREVTMFMVMNFPSLI